MSAYKTMLPSTTLSTTRLCQPMYLNFLVCVQPMYLYFLVYVQRTRSRLVMLEVARLVMLARLARLVRLVRLG